MPVLGVVVEAMPAQPRAALGVPHDPVRCWLLRPRQRSSGGSGSWARRRLGGEAEGIPAAPEAVYPRCHRGPEGRQYRGEPAHREPGRGCCGQLATSPRGASCDRCRERLPPEARAAMPWFTLQIQIPPSLGAPAVRMDGGGLQVKSRTRPRPCAKFPAARKKFLD